MCAAGYFSENVFSEKDGESVGEGCARNCREEKVSAWLYDRMNNQERHENEGM